ncbi:hypothetical protein C5167_008849 [Papaver somniferum]|uniref:Thioredoxin domain-containing protein n=1 Tax=Papaver somniferum TaxID=3469 RepID=A0A4Y7JZF1_PAPSO|nr:hypothetical protein C5167_008849 [Papaver somniferum]
MARNSSSALLRSLLRSRKNKPFSSASIKTLTTSTQISSSSFGNILDNQMKPLSSFASTCVPLFSSLYFSSAARSSVLLHHLVHLILSLSTQNKGLTVLSRKLKMITCRQSSTSLLSGKLISPIIESLSKKYPHVMTFKVDIDQEEIRKKLEELNIMSVPTIHFFQNGKKADEMVGADVARLNQIVERLYSTKN